MEHVPLQLDYLIDDHRNVWAKWHWLQKMIANVADHRICWEMGVVRHDVWHRHHIRCILYEQRGIAMVGMIVIRARREDEMRPKVADQPDNLPPVRQ
jgi:hypothetical protein